jgi:plasmid maintenance system antidote protein VapI
MATTTKPNPTAELLIGNVRTYLEVKSAYDECHDDIKEVINEMAVIFISPESTEDEKRRAALTVVEALFPSLTADYIHYCEAVRKSDSARQHVAEMAEEERLFSERVQARMGELQITQEELAQQIGVGQSAISNMLNRQCRPQRRTIVKIAKALGSAPEELWPGAAKFEAD